MSKMKQRQDLDVMRPGNVAELSFDIYRSLRLPRTSVQEDLQSGGDPARRQGGHQQAQDQQAEALDHHQDQPTAEYHQGAGLLPLGSHAEQAGGVAAETECQTKQ